MSFSAGFSRIFVLSALGLTFALMFAISTVHMFNGPLSTEMRVRGGAGGDSAAAPDGKGVSPEFNLSEEHLAEISDLMSQLKENPNDADTLIALGDSFLRAREWSRAEVFLGRAILSKPSDIRPRYLLGMAQYQQRKLPEAVKTFEELLAVEEDPATLYNLGIIYKYQINNAKRAQELFKKITDSSGEIDREIVEKAQKELD